MIRSFLAVELNDPLRRQLTRVQQELKTHLGQQRSADLRISWAQPASIHLTIKFLGDIAESLVEPLREAIHDVVGTQVPIAIPMDRLGAFPNLQQPRVLWVGPQASWEQSPDARRLTDVCRAIEASCESLGIVSDGKPFRPHLTVARVREGERNAGKFLATCKLLQAPLSLGILAVQSVVLMKSELRPNGSLYTPLWSCRFGGQP